MDKTSPVNYLAQWFNHLLRHPGDDEEVMLSKKIWFSIVVFTIGLVVILIVAWWLLANFPNALILVFFVPEPHSAPPQTGRPDRQAGPVFLALLLPRIRHGAVGGQGMKECKSENYVDPPLRPL